jgi:hypothetical protein
MASTCYAKVRKPEEERREVAIVAVSAAMEKGNEGNPNDNKKLFFSKVRPWFAGVKNQREGMGLLEYQATYPCVTQLMTYGCVIYYTKGAGNSIIS